ncbi:hypothetical protein [Tropicibacter naphthalenivorans]|uniref:Uncharacterized protein n=1 Tax=Tropicibacter naphthalenivorans TaxID=441103 RepID=A0A0P1FZJ0_9RHOB|nr:hypothetical protein [Tropicibacter naphthalenivorans]CUH74771.1 hypothetical protein TRN7648_00076 [Tropicibacter naphthalenivorans]SMC49131.1 hypothetical protein SAMN04488093_101804 [Tropicibacter naphthalenivorans]
MSHFHTPPRPEPLWLDLVSLDGGGSCPAQFYGKTRDGRDVYVRYRGGQLRVREAYGPGDDVMRGRLLCDVPLGPPLDGDLSMHQFCTLTETLVNNAVPPKGDDDRDLDLSGATTFFRQSVWLSEQTAQELLAEIVLDVAPAMPMALPLPGVTVTLFYRPLVHPDRRLTHENKPPHPVARRLGQPIETLFEDGPYGDQFALWASFPTEDDVVRQTLKTLAQRVEAAAPEARTQAFDLETGAHVPEQHRCERIDRRVAAWCLAQENRWLRAHPVKQTVKQADAEARLIGWRPEP